VILAIKRMLAVARQQAAEAEPSVHPLVAGVVGVVLDDATYAQALDEWSAHYERGVQGYGESFTILSCNGPVRVVRAGSIGL
jgi:hypothetical protein